MADAWDPHTGQSIAATDIAELLAAANAGVDAHAHAATDPGPEALCIKLLDHTGAALGQFSSTDKHEAAGRICAFLAQVPPNGRVTVDCGRWAAIALRHQDGRSVQTSFMDRSSEIEPGVLTYPSEVVQDWALRLCATFLFTFTNAKAASDILELGRQRRLQQAHEDALRAHNLSQTVASTLPPAPAMQHSPPLQAYPMAAMSV